MKKKKLAIVGGIAAAVAGIVAYKNRDKIKDKVESIKEKKRKNK